MRYVVAAAFAAGLFASVPAAHAVLPPSCVATAATGSCSFSCHGFDSLSVVVLGPGAVQGSATCGSGTARCVGVQSCEGFGRARGGGAGVCDLTTGAVAICASTPSD